MTPTVIRRLRWAIAAALLVLLFCFCVFVRPSNGATWAHFRFTAPADSAQPGVLPSGVGRYRMEVASAGGWDSVRTYSAPNVEGVPPVPAGTTCDLYVSQTVQPLTSRTYRIVAIDSSGNRAGTSNFVVVATGFPDTIVALSRPALGFGRIDTLWLGAPPQRIVVTGPGADYGFQRTFARPYTSWSLAYGDTAEVHAVHQEELQRASRARLCTLYGFWALRGLPQVCP